MVSNPFTLEGKTILVTGASSGIGKKVAVVCSEMGAKLIITGRDQNRLNNTLEELTGSGHSSIISDLTKADAMDAFVGMLPKLNGVVHCAGKIKRSPLKFINEEQFKDLMELNFFTPALLSQKLFKKKLLESGSSVVFISSVASSYAALGNIMYMSSKGALNSFVKGIALELAQTGIRANAIQPGIIKTNLTAGISDDELEKDILRYPLGRYGKPEEVAYAVVYLLSDATAWMTGSILTIDGGLTLR